MDKIIEKYGEDILSYRFRTARQKKRMQYKDFHKQLIKLHQEEQELYCQKVNLGWEPLIPPIQKGWKRFFVLRDDVAKSKHASFFEGILSKINTYDWSHRKDFIIRTRKRGRKKYTVKRQNLLQPDEYHFLKLEFNNAEKQFFYWEYDFNIWSKKPFKKYFFIEPWRFVLRIRPNMIDKVRIRDEQLESRLKEIDNYLKRNDFRKIQSKIVFGKYKWKNWYQKHGDVNPLKNRPLHKILGDAVEEQFDYR